MVYKVSKGGVRSGNTLRGLRSYKTRRYTRQACIVGRSNLKPIDVPTFLDSHIEDKQISSSLGSTDVALSLNKKKRWLLPATVGHMIKTGSFNDEKTMVSLLERHKLKRRANCVSFVCNQGRIRHVAPRQKRYFSFKLDNIDSTLSNRQRKRQIVKRPEGALDMEGTITKDKNHSPIKTIEVFTLLGAPPVPVKINRFESSKPEYRMEVFYPCPQTCSLAYNPKYTNVHMEFGEEGAMELKSDKKMLKKGRRHRKRFLHKDLEIYDQEIASRDADEMWEDDHGHFESSCVSTADISASNQTVEDSWRASMHLLGRDQEREFDEDDYQVDDNENIFASLIVQAEKARALCENRKTSEPRRKQSRKGFGKATSPPSRQEKSHIVYTNMVHREIAINTSDTRTEPDTRPTNHVTLNSSKVILQSVETTPDNLRAKFGRFYAEADSEPRRFVIDVTEDVQNLVSPYYDDELSAVYTSFLIFVHDGVYDEGLDTFKVIFNSNCCPETEAFKNNILYWETSIDEIMNRVANTVLNMKEDDLLDLSYDQSCGDAANPALNFVNDALMLNVRTFRACDEIRRMSLAEDVQKNVDFSTSLVKIAQDLDCDIFCDICYENINPTQTWDVCGTKLSKCSHIFCDDCWRSHLRARLMDGAVKMTCPGYDCDETVGPVTMLSLLHVSEVSKFFQRKCEEEADSSSNSRWCPNRACGRVIKLDDDKSTNDMSLDVTCSCGEEFCFSCLSHPHWPATCEQAEKYIETLQAVGSSTKTTTDQEKGTKKFYRSKGSAKPSPAPAASNKIPIMEIVGRLCPKCSKFIEKMGGCDFMYCKCGCMFCWACLKTSHGHDPCMKNPSDKFNSIIKLRINHAVIPTVPELSSKDTNKPKPGGTRQMTLFKRAVEEKREVSEFKLKTQISEMVKEIARASQKDLHLKRQILSICGLKTEDKDTDELYRFPLVSHVSKFLRSCCEIKRALHHVAEFTFVLLQDTADSVDKRRALRLANDLSGYCSFIRSILETGQRQDMGAAIKRLADIQVWAKRALTVLLASANNLKH